MLHHTERASGVNTHELVLRLGRDEVAVLVDEVAGMHKEFRLVELQFAGLPKVLAHLCLQLREPAPSLHRLAAEAEGGDAGADVVLVTVLHHEGELARDDSHHGLLWNGVRVVGDAAASGVMLRLEYVLAQFLPCYPQESRFRSQEESLSDAAADVEIVIVRNLFLVV